MGPAEPDLTAELVATALTAAELAPAATVSGVTPAVLAPAPALELPAVGDADAAVSGTVAVVCDSAEKVQQLRAAANAPTTISLFNRIIIVHVFGP